MNAVEPVRGKFGWARSRVFVITAVTIGLFCAAPATAGAIVAVGGDGIAGSGTVSGTWTSGPFSGQSQVLQVASVVTCPPDTFGFPPADSFVATWTDPAGTSHTFRYQQDNGIGCAFQGYPNVAQACLGGTGSSSGLAGDTTLSEELTAPGATNYLCAAEPSNTMEFVLQTPEGTINAPAQFPGRIQPFTQS